MNAAQPDSLVGQVLDGRYQLVERIGEGGMGVVYKAQQLSSGQVVAVKVLNPHMARDQTWVQRFYNEANATSQLQHPNTIRMHEFGQTPSGVLYLAMEFLDGQSLREAIAKSAPMPPTRVLSILSQACASLAEAHALGIIHRDMKPDNVFLLQLPNNPDYVKVLDFSVAKLLQNQGFRTQAGMVFGTPEYMSPEQGRGRQLDARSDLYALGAIAFEMLTGRVPFTDPHNPMAILQAHMTLPVPALPPSVPPAVVELVNRCMAKEPGQRYATADEMRRHAEQIRAQLGGGPPAPSYGGGSPIQTPNPARGGAPVLKTMVAGHNPLIGGPPPAQKTMIAGNQAPSGGPPAAKPVAKTMMASASALGIGQAPPPAQLRSPQERTIPAQGHGPPPPVGGPPPAVGGSPAHGGGGAPAGRKPSSAVAKTMMAGNVADLYGSAGPPALGGPPSMPTTEPPAVGGPPAMPPKQMQPHAQPQHGGGPPKTMMLQPSEGVVSFNMGQNAANIPAAPPPVAVGTGASLGFWLLCLSLGAGIGVGAYFLLLAVSGG